MLTLKQINLSEEELGQVLNFIYEAEEDPDRDMYARFIKEEATLEQKLNLLQIEALKVKAEDPSKVGHLKKGAASMVGAGLFGLFWVAYRVIRAAKNKCSRKCSVIGLNTLLRQKCMAECNVGEAKSAMAAAGKVQCKGDQKCEEKKKKMVAKWKDKMNNAANKAAAYKKKHKDVAFTL
jgi:hypothetical protein